jgi:hypothetical protein
MTLYELTKDIVIPVVAPLSAGLAVVFGFLRHARKASRDAMNALYRDLDWTWQQYRLVAIPNTPIASANATTLTEAWERIFRRIHDDSEAMAEFYRRFLRNAEGEPLLLLGNARIKLEEARTNPQSFLDLELMFALHNFLWLCERDASKNAEHLEILRLFLKKRPEFRDVMVRRPGFTI